MNADTDSDDGDFEGSSCEDTLQTASERVRPPVAEQVRVSALAHRIVHVAVASSEAIDRYYATSLRCLQRATTSPPVEFAVRVLLTPVDDVPMEPVARELAAWVRSLVCSNVTVRDRPYVPMSESALVLDPAIAMTLSDSSPDVHYHDLNLTAGATGDTATGTGNLQIHGNLGCAPVRVALGHVPVVSSGDVVKQFPHLHEVLFYFDFPLQDDTALLVGGCAVANDDGGNYVRLLWAPLLVDAPALCLARVGAKQPCDGNFVAYVKKVACLAAGGCHARAWFRSRTDQPPGTNHTTGGSFSVPSFSKYRQLQLVDRDNKLYSDASYDVAAALAHQCYVQERVRFMSALTPHQRSNVKAVKIHHFGVLASGPDPTSHSKLEVVKVQDKLRALLGMTGENQPRMAFVNADGIGNGLPPLFQNVTFVFYELVDDGSGAHHYKPVTGGEHRVPKERFEAELQVQVTDMWLGGPAFWSNAKTVRLNSIPHWCRMCGRVIARERFDAQYGGSRGNRTHKCGACKDTAKRDDIRNVPKTHETRWVLSFPGWCGRVMCSTCITGRIIFPSLAVAARRIAEKMGVTGWGYTLPPNFCLIVRRLFITEFRDAYVRRVVPGVVDASGLLESFSQQSRDIDPGLAAGVDCAGPRLKPGHCTLGVHGGAAVCGNDAAVCAWQADHRVGVAVVFRVVAYKRAMGHPGIHTSVRLCVCGACAVSRAGPLPI
jgi:hypothetical protein